jgi:hypothetical protein
MGDLNCPKCGNNSFQARSHVNDPHTVTFICVACWEELLLENLTREFVKQREPLKGESKCSGEFKSRRSA